MIRLTALALTALTGFSALVYEVAWQKYIATLLGSHSEATAAVLALFLGGLSLGYALFGHVTRRVVARASERGQPAKLLGLYGLVEATIGLHALVFPWLLEGVRSLSLAIPHQVSGLGFALDVALVGLLILPPTVLMGGTIPVLTQALSKDLSDSTRLHALVYACNTTGAFFGALMAGFVLIPSFGLRSVVLAMGVVNLLAGVCFGILGSIRKESATVDVATDAATVRLGVYAPVALLAGFGAMALQTVLIRVAGLGLGSSEFTFTMVVAVFVLCIAFGSFAVSAMRRVPRGLLLGAQIALVVLLLALYPALGDLPYWAHVVRAAFRDDPLSFYFYYFTLFVLVMLVLVIPVGLSGATLPLIFDRLRQAFGGLGAAAGRLYAWNTVGSLLGALLGGYLLLFWLDLDRVYALAVGAIATSAVLVAVQQYRLPKWASVFVVPALSLPLLLPSWPPEMLSAGLFRSRSPSEATMLGPGAALEHFRRTRPLAFYADDPTSSVAVVHQTREGETVERGLAILTNGKSDGSTLGDYPTMALVALLPALFVEELDRAFVIGFGTGVTAGELAALDQVSEVVVAEISPAVIEAAPLFDPYNLGAMSNPKTRIVVSDAYRALQGSDVMFDLIVSEPSNPWVAGVEMLYSQEFLETARQRLTPGGVFAQWMHLYETDDEVLDLVLRTYASVFENVSIWFTLGADVILLGHNDAQAPLDMAGIERRARRPDVAAGLARSGVESLPSLFGRELLPVGVTRAIDLDGAIHTLGHPTLNHRAARAFFGGGRVSLPAGAGTQAASVGQRTSLLARHIRRSGGLSDDDYLAVASVLCTADVHRCATLVARWHIDHPDSSQWGDFVEQRRSLGDDGEPFSAENLGDLTMLLGGRPLSEGRISVAEATRLTSVFTTHYYHAMPFDRRALHAVWQRCQSPGRVAACFEARRQVETQIGLVDLHARTDVEADSRAHDGRASTGSTGELGSAE